MLLALVRSAVSPMLQGHSIGGSMATLLMLMYRIRGVLPNHSIAPVVTFGAPAVFCLATVCNSASSRLGSEPGMGLDGSCSSSEDEPVFDSPPPSGPPGQAHGSVLMCVDSQSSSGTAACSADTCSCGLADMLLPSLGLPEHIVRNVTMARDVVPRAFACDYRQVAVLAQGALAVTPQ